MYQFGIVECRTGFEIIYYYVHHKGEGKKGGEKVVLCLVEKFKEMGYFSHTCIGDITICANNCGGQSKNQTFIWLIIWITEAGFFQK